MGLESGSIPDSSITASSEYRASHGAKNARLHLQAVSGRTGAWSAGSESEPWMQVNFGREVQITGVATQGRTDSDQWVKTYTLSYSNDGTHFIDFLENAAAKVCQKR